MNRDESAAEVGALASALTGHAPIEEDCDPGGLVCSNPDHLAAAILASDWLVARDRVVAAAAAAAETAWDEALEAVAWTQANGGIDLGYVAKHNPHRAAAAHPDEESKP